MQCARRESLTCQAGKTCKNWRPVPLKLLRSPLCLRLSLDPKGLCMTGCFPTLHRIPAIFEVEQIQRLSYNSICND